MKACLNALAALLLLTAPAAAQVSLRWTADAARPASADFSAYQGETVRLEPSFQSYGSALSLTNATASLYWQTNGMGSAWWTKPAEVVTGSPDRVRAVFHPTNDVGAAAYAFFVGLAGPGGVSYRAFGSLAMRASPGFSPSSAPSPAYYPTLAAELAPLVAPLLSIGYAPAYSYTDAATNRLAAAITNEASLRGAADIHLQDQITLLSESGSITGQVGSASLSDSALRLASADSNWWVSVDAGTATLWQASLATTAVTRAFVVVPPSPVSTFGVELGDVWSYARFDYGGSETNYVYTSDNGHAEELVCFVGKSWSDPYWMLSPTALYQLAPHGTNELALVDGTNHVYLAETNLVTFAVTTNAVGTYATAADLAAALAAYNPAAATNALALASNAWRLAGSAYSAATNADARITAATNAVMRALISTNAWIEANASSNTVSVYVVSTNGTNVVTVGGVTGIDPAATNLLWIALNSGLSAKAPRAWGGLAPDGTANPDPEFQTWLNAPATVFASGYTWTTYGLYAAIVSTGMVAQATGSNGMWRISVDSTNYLGVVQGGSVIVGARANSLAVYEGGTTNGWARLTYDYFGGNFPTLYFTPSLAADFTQVVSALWTDNLDGSATVVAPAASARGFWRAMTSSSYSYALESTMPFRAVGGVIGATNAPPVRYDSTVEISAGGHTYRIPAQLAD